MENEVLEVREGSIKAGEGEKTVSYDRRDAK